MNDEHIKARLRRLTRLIRRDKRRKREHLVRHILTGDHFELVMANRAVDDLQRHKQERRDLLAYLKELEKMEER